MIRSKLVEPTTATATSMVGHQNKQLEQEDLMPTVKTEEDMQTCGFTDADDSLLDVSRVRNAVMSGSNIFIVLILLTGVAASAGFFGISISSAHREEQGQFDRRASELVNEIKSSWNDYEVAGLWIHEACRSGISRTEFRELYEHLRSGGLEFQAAEFIPKVTNEERILFEEESRAFLAEQYPDINYRGFVGFEPVEPNSTELSIQPRSEQPFYYVVHYVEPVEPNAAAIDLDLYSSSKRRVTIEAALETWNPALTDRLRLVQETDASAYSVLLMHPGIPLDTEPDLQTHDLSLMVIRIPSLLARAARFQRESLTVYLYDLTHASEDVPPDFLGGVEVHVDHDNGESTDVKYLDEVERSELLSRDSSVKVYSSTVGIASSTWEIVVVPLEGTYEARPVFEIFGGTMIFAACACVAFWMYSNNRRQRRINQIQAEAKAERAIVQSLFPSNVRARLIQDAEDQAARVKKVQAQANPKMLRETDSDDSGTAITSSESIFGSKPIADLFTEVTVMFADLVGFTAWSSARDPTQVFTLLEIIYHSFDTIAKRRKVFKLETVGDCYVAVAGLPDARKDHAQVMAYFATDCMNKMHNLTRSLEVTLGPDTADLDIRIGLHSGPVTAGVLRGDKGRFQLFGDTMNTASRMESTGVPSRIQVSLETANLIEAAGKKQWLTQREDRIYAKGKGELLTYWVDVRPDLKALRRRSSERSSITKPQESAVPSSSQGKRIDSEQRINRLINWNVEVFSRILRQIVARRAGKFKKRSEIIPIKNNRNSRDGTTVLDEVKDIIALPEFDASTLRRQIEPDSVQLDPEVVAEMTDFVSVIADMYQKNPFHNFEHASHVVMSVTKLLARIIGPKDQLEVSTQGVNNHEKMAANHHDYTFGITSDPLTHFACVFSALIHDVDHPGVPNAVLVKEQTDLSRFYKNKSVAEQNSVDLAWEILMSDTYGKFRSCIFVDQDELLRFRELVVNMVMATDVMDKDLGSLRKARWEVAFSDRDMKEETLKEDVDRKATIVIEHLIQASDVSHTMQHWHVYRKWNERLFLEMYGAYKQGRLDKDPSINWCESEKGFLDFYVIPLAKKLDTCGVFGVTSDELRLYAEANRKEWEIKGEDMVRSYKDKYRALHKSESV